MFTKEHLIEEYRLPTKPLELRRRLRDIIKAHQRMYANTTNALIKAKIAFLEEWEKNLVVPQKNAYINTAKKH